MADVCAGMAANLLRLSTGLLTRIDRVLAVPWSMAVFHASVRTTFQQFPTDESAPRINMPAGLILQGLFPAETFLLCEVRTLWTRLCISMAVVLRLRMTTRFWPLARAMASRRFRPTRLRWIQNCSPTIARNLFKDSLSAGIARALVTQLRTSMLSAFEQPSADARANVFRLYIVIARHGNVHRLELSLRGLPLKRLASTGTASLLAGMSSATHCRATDAETHWRLIHALLTHRYERVSLAAAFQFDSKEARRTRAGVTWCWTGMSAGKYLLAGLVAVRNRVLA